MFYINPFTAGTDNYKKILALLQSEEVLHIRTICTGSALLAAQINIFYLNIPEIDDRLVQIVTFSLLFSGFPDTVLTEQLGWVLSVGTWKLVWSEFKPH